MKSGFKSIKTKMLVLLGTLIVIICASMGVTSYLLASRALEMNVNVMLPQMAGEAAKVVNSRVQEEFRALETIASMDEISSYENTWEQKKVILDEMMKRDGYIRIGIADKAGKVVYTNGKTAYINDMQYYKSAINGKNTVSDPIADKTDNSLVVIFSVPIRYNGNIIGTLNGVRDGNELSIMTNDITFGKTGKAYLVNSTGSIIAHGNKDLVMNATNFIEESKKDASLKSLADVIKQMSSGKSGSGRYTYLGIDKYCGFAPVEGTGWSICITGERREILSELNTIVISDFMSTLVYLAVGFILIILISRSIAGSLTVAAKQLDAISGGDLTMEIPPKLLKMKDEIGKMASAIKKMQDSLKEMLKSITDSSKDIDSQSENLSAVSEEISSSSESVATAIQDVAKGAGSQAQDLVDVVGVLDEFGQELEDMVQSLENIDSSSKSIGSMSDDSNKKMQSLIQSVNKVSASFKEFSTNISGFGQNVKQINDITNLINSIADQTNLLALNAAIEAARAGEAGRGFAVVADEIRQLAEQTKVSSENINRLIGSITSDTDGMIKTSGVMSHELNNQADVINDAIASFRQITDAIQNINPKIASVSSSASQIEKEKDTILEKIQGVSSVAEEVSASSEEIAASSEEMNASIEEVASASQVLSSKTKEMMDHVNKFKF